MNKYMVYIDNNGECFRLAIPAKNEKEARKLAEGNGDIIAVKNVTSDYPIYAEKVAEALFKSNFGDDEVEFIVRCLQNNNIVE